MMQRDLPMKSAPELCSHKCRDIENLKNYVQRSVIVGKSFSDEVGIIDYSFFRHSKTKDFPKPRFVALYCT